MLLMDKVGVGFILQNILLNNVMYKLELLLKCRKHSLYVYNYCVLIPKQFPYTIYVKPYI